MIALPDPSIRYLEGSPDQVERLLDYDGELLLFGANGAGDHLVGKGEGVRGDAVGPPVVLQHGGQEGFGEKQVPCESRTRGLCASQRSWGEGVGGSAVSHTDASWGGKGGKRKRVRRLERWG